MVCSTVLFFRFNTLTVSPPGMPSLLLFATYAKRLLGVTANPAGVSPTGIVATTVLGLSANENDPKNKKPIARALDMFIICVFPKFFIFFEKNIRYRKYMQQINDRANCCHLMMESLSA